jgi:lipoteichoic acid synthase
LGYFEDGFQEEISLLLVTLSLYSVVAYDLWRRPDSRLISIHLLVLSILVVGLKSYLAMNELATTHFVGLGGFLLMISLSSFLYALSLACFDGLTPWAVMLFQVGLSFLFWADVLYFRFFQDILSVYLWSGGGQVGQVLESAWSAARGRDILLFADIPVWFWLAWHLDKKRFSRNPPQIIGLMVLALLGTFAVPRLLNPLESDILKRRFYNRLVVSRIGLLCYHVYDLAGIWQSDSLKRGDWEDDPDQIAVLVERAVATVEAESEYQGLLSGRNVVVVQLESLQGFASEVNLGGEPVMPFTRSLLDRSLVLNMMDQSHHGRSSDGEFCMLNGVHPPPLEPVCFGFAQNKFGGLVQTLNGEGYTTLYAMPYSSGFWNARHMTSRYGFARALFEQELGPTRRSERLAWGMTDRVFFQRALERLDELPQPFFAYWVTLGSHHPFDEVPAEQRKLSGFPPDLSQLARDYLECCRFRDDALNSLVASMEARGDFQDTVLILVGDHDAALPESDLKALGLGSVESEDRVKAIIYAPGTPWPEPMDNVPAGQIDFAPTLLHLLGLSSSFPHLGWNVLSSSRPFFASRKGYVIDQDGQLLMIEQGDPEGSLTSAGRQELRVSQGLLELDLLGTPLDDQAK